MKNGAARHLRLVIGVVVALVVGAYLFQVFLDYRETRMFEEEFQQYREDMLRAVDNVPFIIYEPTYAPNTTYVEQVVRFDAQSFVQFEQTDDVSNLVVYFALRPDEESEHMGSNFPILPEAQALSHGDPWAKIYQYAAPEGFPKQCPGITRVLRQDCRAYGETDTFVIYESVDIPNYGEDRYTDKRSFSAVIEGTMVVVEFSSMQLALAAERPNIDDELQNIFESLVPINQEKLVDWFGLLD